ncbi:MAG: hypothetical protein OHK0039_34260 [Bacteroidia bacterium]
MKKLYAMVLAFGLLATTALAQVNVTFQVDLTDYLAAGNTLATVKIAGNFTSNGASVPDWNPPGSPTFTDLGNNIWGATITYLSTSVGNNQLFKFLNTADSWGNCGVQQECLSGDGECYDKSNGDGNRLLVIPSSDTTICFKWNTCTTCTAATGIEASVLANPLVVSPNPFGISARVSLPVGWNQASVELYSLAGQRVRHFEVRGDSFEVVRGELQAGIYFLHVQNTDGVRTSHKLLIQ